MFKKKPLSYFIQGSLLTYLALSSSAAITAEDKPKDSENNTTADSATEQMVVRGVRASLEDASAIKKRANQILDAISAEDIGQLPDKNIAEALQRVTGIQIGRDGTGGGSGFQVRGLSQNRVEIDGMTMAGSGEERSNSFASVDSALFSGIEVIKSPTADMIEGAIGATVRLKTHQPLNMKKAQFNINTEANKNSLDKRGNGISLGNTGSKISIMGTRNFDLGFLGELGTLINASYDDKLTETHTLSSNWAPALENQIQGSEQFNGLTLFRPENIEARRQVFKDENRSFGGTLQWQPTESIEFRLNGTTNQFSRAETDDKMSFRTNHRNNLIIDRDLPGTQRNDAPVVIGPISRLPQADEYQDASIRDTTQYVPYTGSVDRYILSSGSVTPVGGNFSQPATAKYNSKVTDERQKTYGLTGIFQLSDTLRMEAQYAFSSMEKTVDEYGIGTDPIRQRIIETNLEDGESAAPVVDAITYFDYQPGSDFPEFGIVTPNTSQTVVNAALTDINSYSVGDFESKEEHTRKKLDSFAVDFDWDIDRGGFTTLEFGARTASHRINRRKAATQQAWAFKYSIFSHNWLMWDRDFNTAPEEPNGNTKPSFAFVDQHMEEQTGVANYLTRHVGSVDGLFPHSPGAANGLSWINVRPSHNELGEMIDVFFPGRQGDCSFFDLSSGLCRQNLDYEANGLDVPVAQGARERDHILTIPKRSQRIVDEAFPYLIEEATEAVYFKANFESELFDIPFMGNIGVRYIATETDVLGIQTLGLTDSQGQPYRDNDDVSIRQFNPIYGSLEQGVAPQYTPKTQKYSNTLPSMNINFMLSDDMFLRFAAAKSMTRPQPQDLSPSLKIEQFSRSAKSGNSNLRPEQATSYDISWEWYIDKTNTLSAALFRKELKDFLFKSFTYEISPFDQDGNGDLDDPIAIERKENGSTGTINGVELAATHVFDYLPGFLDGFGVTANYTFTDSSQDSGVSELGGQELPVPNLSENSYNFVIFYDKYNFNFRAAYNCRDESFDQLANSGPDLSVFRPYNTANNTALFRPKGAALPVWNDEFDTLDISLRYRYKKASFFLQARNILKEAGRKYVGDKDGTKYLLREYRETGANYTAGVSVRF